MRKSRIVVIGSLIFDFVATADRLPRKGETVLGRRFGMHTGGKGANQAVQAARLGAEVYMVGRVGDDFLGERLLSNLKSSGVNTGYIKKDSGASTSACCIHVDDNGDNAIIISPDANMAVTVDDVMNAREVILSADMVICQLEISMEATTFALELASQNSIPVILNPAPARNIPDGFFSKTQFITPNETETEFFTGVEIDEADLSNSADKAVSKLLGLGARAVVMTLGKKGAFVANERIRELMKGFTIKAVDATAAGDAFNGALAVALAEGKDIRDAVVFANGAGALAASKPGAQSSLCSRDELEEFLRACGY